MTTMRSNALKTPPYSVASEKLVLGAILRSPDILPRVQSIVPASASFFRPEHCRLYDALIAAFRKGAKDTEQLIAMIASQGKGAPETSEDQLREFAATGYDLAAALHHAEVVSEKARMRELIDALTDILHDTYHGDDGFDAILMRAKKRLAEFKTMRARRRVVSAL